MTTKPVRGITIKDGKVKLKMHYRDASHAIRSKKSTKQRVVRKSEPSPLAYLDHVDIVLAGGTRSHPQGKRLHLSDTAQKRVIRKIK